MELIVLSTDASHKQYKQVFFHQTGKLLGLTECWFNLKRIGCANYELAIVTTATTLSNYGLRFTNVLQSATKQFHIKPLYQIKLSRGGNHEVMVSEGKNEKESLRTLLWIYRDCRYFVTTFDTNRPSESILRPR